MGFGGLYVVLGVPSEPPNPILSPPDQAQTKLKGVIYFQAIEEVWYDPGRVAGKVRRAGGEMWGRGGSVGLGCVGLVWICGICGSRMCGVGLGSVGQGSVGLGYVGLVRICGSGPDLWGWMGSVGHVWIYGSWISGLGSVGQGCVGQILICGSGICGSVIHGSGWNLWVRLESMGQFAIYGSVINGSVIYGSGWNLWVRNL